MLNTIVLLLLTFFLNISNFLFSQHFHSSHEIDSTELALHKEELLQNWNSKNALPSEFELAILVALHNYPELHHKDIRFKYQNIKTTLNARPTIGSLFFKSRKNRSYVIRINNQKKDSIIALKNVPFDAQVGIFAHEFAHFKDYQSRSFFRVLARGLAYLSKRSKRSFEKSIDLKTIENGYGQQVLAWSNYLYNDSNATAEYKVFKSETYMNPEEIQQAIDLLSPQ